MRVKELLPSDAEVKALSVVPESNFDSLHDTEKALVKLSKVAECRGKVLTLAFILNFEGSKKHVDVNCNKLWNGAGNHLHPDYCLYFVVISRVQCVGGKIIDSAKNSEGLAEVRKSVLAIGNAMNDGTWKGGAVGFKLSSITRLSQTKSADGKSSVLDYLVKVWNPFVSIFKGCI